MGNKRIKFIIGIGILLVAVGWLGLSGYDEGKSYFKTADEFVKLSASDQHRPIRLMGHASAIARSGDALSFDVSLNGATVPVVYTGTDPIPDTFKDGVEVLVEGSLGTDGRFVGRKIQAKCASKYESNPADAYPGQASS